mgnify:CR=1 FL=1
MKFDPIGSSQTRLTVSLAELVGAFSYALDITEGQPAGHHRPCRHALAEQSFAIRSAHRGYIQFVAAVVGRQEHRHLICVGLLQGRVGQLADDGLWIEGESNRL